MQQRKCLTDFSNIDPGIGGDTFDLPNPVICENEVRTVPRAAGLDQPPREFTAAGNDSELRCWGCSLVGRSHVSNQR